MENVIQSTMYINYVPQKSVTHIFLYLYIVDQRFFVTIFI